MHIEGRTCILEYVYERESVSDRSGLSERSIFYGANKEELFVPAMKGERSNNNLPLSPTPSPPPGLNLKLNGAIYAGERGGERRSF